MPKPTLGEAIGRVLVASAWTDGKLDDDERRAMEDLLVALPDLSIEAWRGLERDMREPLDETERRRRFEELQGVLRTAEDVELCRSALLALAGRASPLSEQDREMLHQLVDQLAVVTPEQEPTVLGKLAGWLRSPLQSRSDRNREHQARRRQFEKDVRGRVLNAVRERLGWHPNRAELDPENLDRICIMGAILARVAHADDHVCDAEFERIRELLVDFLDDDMLAASIVTEIVVSEVADGLDTYALVREYFHDTEEAERLRFLDLMFQVADADQHVSTVEMEEIRIISQSMLLSHKQFIDAKVKIPRQRRDS